MTYLPTAPKAGTPAAALSGTDGLSITQAGLAKLTTLAVLKAFVNGTTAPTSTQSAELATITGTTGSIVDAAGVVYTLIALTGHNYQIAINGTPDPATHDVVALVMHNGNCWQGNTLNQWYAYIGGVSVGQSSGDPRVTPPVVTPATAAATLTGVPSAATVGGGISGVGTTLTPTGATGYAVLYTGGADVGARTAFTGAALPALVPSGAGNTTIRVYSAATGATLLRESATIAVTAALSGALSGYITQAQSSLTASFGTAVVPNAAVRVASGAGEATSGTIITTAGPTITIFDGSVWSLQARPDNQQLAVAKNGALTRDSSNNINTGPVASLLYFDGKMYQLAPGGAAYTNYGNGTDWYQVSDPRTAWNVGDPRAPNRPIPYGLGLKAENPGESGQGLITWHNNLSRFTQIVGAPTYCGVFINFGDPPSLWAGDCVGTANAWAADPTSANLIPVCGFPMAQNNHYYGTSGTYGGTAYTHANNYDFDQFISGAYDSVVQGCVNAWLDKFNRVDFRPGYEFNGGFMPWYQGNDATTQGKFVAAFKRIHDQMKSALAAWPARYAAANGGTAYSGPAKVVNVVWNPASINGSNLEAFNSYPGDAYVDIIGIDDYSPLYPLDYWNFNSTGGGVIDGGLWAADATNRQHFWDFPGGKQYSFNGAYNDAGTGKFTGLQSMILFAKAHGKHICFPECGAGGGVGPFDEFAFPTWLRSRCDQAVAAGVPVDYLIIWCTRQSDGQWGFLDSYEKPYEALAWSAAFGGGGTGVVNYYPPAPTPIPTLIGAPAVFQSLAPPSPSGTTTITPVTPTTPSPVAESASGTLISAVGASFGDSHGTSWSIGATATRGSGHALLRNGVDQGVTAGVTMALYYQGVVYYNNSFDWFSLNADGSALAGPIADPRSTTTTPPASGGTISNVVINVTGTNGVSYQTILTPSDFSTLYASNTSRTYGAGATGLGADFYVFKDTNGAAQMDVYTGSTAQFASITITRGGQAVVAYGFPNITYN